MGEIDFLQIFQGVATLTESEPKVMIGRVALILVGFALIYLGKKGVLEALIMVPMGIGMCVVNAAVMFVPAKMVLPDQIDAVTGLGKGTLHLNPLVSEGAQFINLLQIQWLQPVYSFMFSNGLIACLVFFGIGSLLDVGFVMARPFKSMFIALCAEFGTVVAFPLAVWFGLPLADAAATATIGGADGPMILFAALILSEDLFVPITVVAYLYLGLTYGGYPFMIKALVPKRIRGLQMPMEHTHTITAGEKIVFAVIACTALCLLFPVAAPLFLALFTGVIVREAGLNHYQETFSGPVLYGATFFLGLLLGVLCEASTILKPEVLILLVIGILALAVSGFGGLMGGYVLYYWHKRKGINYNPVIGIAGVSCVPTCAKVAQKTVSEVNPGAIIMPHALGASISGVITSAVFAAVLITVVRASGASAF